MLNTALSRLRVLLVIDSLGSGGAQRQMVNLACGLKVKGHHPSLFVYYSESYFLSELENASIPVHLNSKPSRFSVAPVTALRRLIRFGQFDIVISFLNTPNLYNEIAHIGLAEAKIVISERSMYPHGNLPWMLRLQQECHRLADAITVNSHHQRERMEHYFPWMKRKIRTIYNGFDLEAFQPSVSFHSNDGRFSLLAISSVSFKKNSLNLAKAIVICRKKYQLDVHVDWIGVQQVSREGMLPMKETSAYLKEFGVCGLWNWLGERTNISEMLTCHDALVHPSFCEGLPNVVCEALACGLPVLVSNVCDHAILVQDGVTGYLFDPASPESIAETIYAFSRLEPSDRLTMGAAARRFAEKNLSLQRYISDYENLFYSLDGQKRESCKKQDRLVSTI